MNSKFLSKNIINSDKKIIDVFLEDKRSETLNNLLESSEDKKELIKNLKEEDIDFDQKPKVINNYILFLSSSLIQFKDLLEVYYMSNILLRDDKTTKIIIQHFKYLINIEGTSKLIQEIRNNYNHLPGFTTILMENMKNLALSIFVHNIKVEDKIKYHETKILKWYKTRSKKYEPLSSFIKKINTGVFSVGELFLMYIYIEHDNLEIFIYLYTKHKNFGDIKVPIQYKAINILNYLVDNNIIHHDEFKKEDNIKTMLLNYDDKIYKLFKKFNKKIPQEILSGQCEYILSMGSGRGHRCPNKKQKSLPVCKGCSFKHYGKKLIENYVKQLSC